MVKKEITSFTCATDTINNEIDIENLKRLKLFWRRIYNFRMSICFLKI